MRGTGDLAQGQKLLSLAMDISAGTGKDRAIPIRYDGQVETNVEGGAMNVCRLLAAGMLLCAALPGRAACPVDAAAQAPLQQASRQGFAWAAVK